MSNRFGGRFFSSPLIWLACHPSLCRAALAHVRPVAMTCKRQAGRFTEAGHRRGLGSTGGTRRALRASQGRAVGLGEAGACFSGRRHQGRTSSVLALAGPTSEAFERCFQRRLVIGDHRVCCAVASSAVAAWLHCTNNVFQMIKKASCCAQLMHMRCLPVPRSSCSPLEVHDLHTLWAAVLPTALFFARNARSVPPGWRTRADAAPSR